MEAIKPVPKKNTFSLYMAKNGDTPFDDLLTDKAQERLAAGHAQTITSDYFADGAALYVFPGQRKPP